MCSCTARAFSRRAYKSETCGQTQTHKKLSIKTYRFLHRELVGFGSDCDQWVWMAQMWFAVWANVKILQRGDVSERWCKKTEHAS
jgi:hypothetical protein